MTASQPTILATSGGLRRGSRTSLEFGPLLHYALELSRPEGSRPRLCHLGTAGGDQRSFNAEFSAAGELANVSVCHLNLFPMPSYDQMEEVLLSQDVIWVGGGSVANLLAIWQIHGLYDIFPRVWQAGVVLAGVSAGSLCWHVGGTTDSYGPTLRPVTNGLALLPYSNGVHYDSEPQRRPLYQRLIAEGTIPPGYATDDGVGLHYRGVEMVEAVSEQDGKSAYYVEREGDVARERAIPTRRLPETHVA